MICITLMNYEFQVQFLYLLSSVSVKYGPAVDHVLLWGLNEIIVQSIKIGKHSKKLCPLNLFLKIRVLDVS